MQHQRLFSLCAATLSLLSLGACAHVDEIDAALADADYVFVGERHDHPEHHRLQAKILARWVELGHRPVVVFEQLDDVQQPLLDAHLATHPGDAAGIGAAVAWDKTGWPPWATYQPIFDVAVAAKLPIVAGLFPRKSVRDVYAKGAEVVFPDAAMRVQLALDKPESPQLEAALTAEVVEGHCNEIDATAAQPMVTIQKTRDAMMARRIFERSNGAGAFLVTGLEHARRDLGVARYLLRLNPDARIVSIALVERGRPAPLPDAHDLVITTDALPEEDHCAQLRQQMHKGKK